MPSQMLPVVGLSTYRELSRHGVWSEVSDLLPSEYADALRRAGGVPVLLPVPGAGVAAADVARAAETLVARLDGLVISGGGDVSPAAYGEEPHPRTGGVLVERDAWEMALLDAAYDRGIPVLGICRGMQVMAVHAGGSLEQHVPDRVGSVDHSPGGDVYGPTTVTVTPGSRLASLIGESVVGNCHHHQSVAKHPGFDAVAVSADGTLEAMEAPGGDFRVAVQWHPETSAEAGLFTGFVAAVLASSA
jgi:putative glutamine amidotransferase